MSGFMPLSQLIAELQLLPPTTEVQQCDYKTTEVKHCGPMGRDVAVVTFGYIRLALPVTFRTNSRMGMV